MLHSITISVEIRNRGLGKILSEEFLKHPNITIVSPGSTEEPNIFFIDDDSQSGNILSKISTLHRKFAKAQIFVVSSDSSPDHIIEVMKAGASEYFLTPLNPQKIREAVERVQFQSKGRQEANGAVYAFLSSKGGLGATVLSVNVAAALAAQKMGRTGLIDLCLQSGDSSVLLDLVPKTTIVDIARSFDRLDAALIAGVVEKHDLGIDLIAAPASPEEAAEVNPEHVQRLLQLCRGMYQRIVVDCPSITFDDRMQEVFRAADKTFIITDMSVPAVRNASRLLKIFYRAGFPPKKLEVVANRFAKGQAGTIEDVEKTLGRRLYWLFPNDFENTMASTNRGTPIMKYNPRAPLARSIVEFAQRLVEPAAMPNYRGIKGLLGKAI